MKRKILIGVLVLIVVAGIVGYYMYSKKVQNYAEGDADVTVTVKELIEAFDKDTASAGKRVMDKKVRVMGNVKSLDSSAVVLAEGDGPSSVVVGFDERNKKSILQLKVGEAATLQGKFSGYAKASADPDDMLSALGTTINIDYAGVVSKQ